MAKSKHSIALFEVVQSAKRQNRSSSDMLRTPKWWFKSRTKMPSACPTPNEPSVMSMPSPVAAPVAAPVETPAASSVPAPRHPGVDLKLDPDKQRITFHVSYTSAAVTAFSIIVVLTMAYVVGTHMANGPSHAVAGMTTEQLLKTPARPEVLNVKPETPKNVTSEVTPISQSQQQSGSETAQPKQTTVAENREAAATASRFAGRNYVVMQIYKDEAKATEIAKRLTDAGVPSSVTRGLEGYAEDSWYCVVGLTGFEKLSGNATYKQYLSTIVSLNEKWSAADSKFKKLQPQTYKWKAAG